MAAWGGGVLGIILLLLGVVRLGISIGAGDRWIGLRIARPVFMDVGGKREQVMLDNLLCLSYMPGRDMLVLDYPRPASARKITVEHGWLRPYFDNVPMTPEDIAETGELQMENPNIYDSDDCTTLYADSETAVRFRRNRHMPLQLWVTTPPKYAIPSLLLSGMILSFPITRKTWRSMTQKRPGHCARCDYDLKGSPDARSCPECGRVFAATA